MAERAVQRAQQGPVLALLLALGALGIPATGAVLYGGTEPSGFAFLGATSQYDFVPVLMLVGALAILVIAGAGADAPRPPVASIAAGTVVLAGAGLVLAYFGAAFHLRAGGAFGFGAADDHGWSLLRLAVVASMVMTGVVCGGVALFAATWLRDRPIKEQR